MPLPDHGTGCLAEVLWLLGQDEFPDRGHTRPTLRPCRFRAAGVLCVPLGNLRSRPVTPGLLGVALGAEAVREWDQSLLAAVDRAIRFLRRGHSAGERLLVSAARELEGKELRRWVGRLPGGAPLRAPPGVEIVGLIRFAAAPTSAPN